MSTPNVIQWPYNWWTDRKGQKIVAIIAHNTVGTDSRSYLSRGGERADGSDRKVSVHVLIQKDGTIYRYVPDERGANHAGFGTMPPPWSSVNPNRCTLGFELENARPNVPNDLYTEPQLLAMGWQIVQWRKRWGSLPIYRHAGLDPTRRTDPVGLSVDEIERWVQRAGQPQIRRFIATATCPIFESREHPNTIALGGKAAVQPDDVFEVDQEISGWLHFANNVGFLPRGAAKEQQL